MIPVPHLFQTDEKGLAIPKVTPGCEWVLDTKGLLTIKIDGLTVQIKKDDGIVSGVKAYVRTIKADHLNLAATYAVANRSYKVDNPVFEAMENYQKTKHSLPEGVYVVYGPDIRNNPQRADKHYMIRIAPVDAPLILYADAHDINWGNRDCTVQKLYDQLKKELNESPDIEGLVFQYEHPGMHLKKAAQVTRQDFGYVWPPAKPVQQALPAVGTAQDLITH